MSRNFYSALLELNDTICYPFVSVKTQSQLIVSTLTLMNSGVVKFAIATVNVILQQPETKVLVINSF